MVVQPDSVPVQPQGGYGIQETGRQPAQSAVAQGRLRLQLLQDTEVFAVACQNGFHLAVDSKVYHIIG